MRGLGCLSGSILVGGASKNTTRVSGQGYLRFRIEIIVEIGKEHLHPFVYFSDPKSSFWVLAGRVLEILLCQSRTCLSNRRFSI
jgi:hypothetical protein